MNNKRTENYCKNQKKFPFQEIFWDARKRPHLKKCGRFRHNEKPGLLEGIADKAIEIVLYDRSYDEDFLSNRRRWSNEPFRDPETGALVMWALPYLMPNGDGWKAIGVYNISLHEWNQDRTSYDSQRTYEHEKRHAKGDDEYLARFNTSDYNSG